MKRKASVKKVGAKKKLASKSNSTKSASKKSFKDRLLDGVTQLVKSKKNSKPVESEEPVVKASGFVNPLMPDQDPAHRPGHRRMNVKANFDSGSGLKTRPQNESAMNRMSDSDRISRNNMQRRIILQNGK